MKDIYENFLKELAEVSTAEEKGYAMVAAYDAMEEAGYDEGEKMLVWKQMLMAQGGC